MADIVKRGRAILVWSFPLFIVSVALSIMHATHAPVTLGLVMLRLGAVIAVGSIFTLLAQNFDDRIDDTWQAISGYAFAATCVAGLTLLGSLTGAMLTSSGTVRVMAMLFLVWPCLFGLALFGYVIASATGLRIFNVMIALGVQSAALSVLVVAPNAIATYVVAVSALLGTCIGIWRSRTPRTT